MSEKVRSSSGSTPSIRTGTAAAVELARPLTERRGAHESSDSLRTSFATSDASLTTPASRRCSSFPVSRYSGAWIAICPLPIRTPESIILSYAPSAKLRENTRSARPSTIANEVNALLRVFRPTLRIASLRRTVSLISQQAHLQAELGLPSRPGTLPPGSRSGITQERLRSVLARSTPPVGRVSTEHQRR